MAKLAVKMLISLSVSIFLMYVIGFEKYKVFDNDDTVYIFYLLLIISGLMFVSYLYDILKINTDNSESKRFLAEPGDKHWKG